MNANTPRGRLLRGLWVGFLTGVIWAEPPVARAAEPANLLDDLKTWKVEAGGGSVEQATPGGVIVIRSGEKTAAIISRAIMLSEGLQEILVEASGQGTILIEAGENAGLGSRELALGEKTASFGLTFMGKRETQPVRIRMDGSASLQSARLMPAPEEQLKLYEKRENEIRQFGFFTTSFQRPEPFGANVDTFGVDPRLPAKRNVAVLDDPMASETVHVRNGRRLRDWLALNGARKMNTPALVAWIDERLKQGDAYGGVIVLTYGFTPMELVEEVTPSAPWFRFMKEGGRFVNIGDPPLYNSSSTTLRPWSRPVTSASQAPLDVMRLPYGWNQPLWGRPLPVTQTSFGKAWGLENAGASTFGSPPDRLTMPFFIFQTPDHLVGASTWFKNFNPRKPWGGFVQLVYDYDGANDSVLRDVWRGIYYAGEAVKIPPLPAAYEPPAPPQAAIVMEASGMKDRSAFGLGEKIAVHVTGASLAGAKAITCRLVIPNGQAVKLIPKAEAAGWAAEWDSQGYAPGSYAIEATWTTPPGNQEKVVRTFPLVGVPTRDFAYQIWIQMTTNPTYNRAMLEDLQKAGMDAYLTEPTIRYMDEILAAGRPFSARTETRVTPRGKDISFEKTPEYFKLDIHHQPVPNASYAGGRPTPSLCHPDVLQSVDQFLRESLSSFKDHPGFDGVVIGNDDLSVYLGWDFADQVVQRFKQTTGRDAPTAKPTPPKAGLVPDNDPWIAWNAFTLRDVTGRYYRTQQKALNDARPGTHFMTIPGGMQIPLISTWEAAQYPPLNFGPNGHSLIGSYYYNTYWQPQMTSTFWMEAGRMANRDLPEWTMPDCMGTGGREYVRNNFYHTLAGGVSGLAYFTYEARRKPDWEELKELGRIVANVAPVQAALQPADRRIALLISLSTLCYEGSHAIQAVYAYENLLQAGYSVDLLCEEEILRGDAKRYQAVVLHAVGWLRESVAKKLGEFAQSGGKLLLDASVPFDLEGAQRLGVELGSGGAMAPATDFKGGAGSRQTYGKTESVRAVRTALAPHLKPDFTAGDIRLVESKFKVGPTPYAWFVNAHNSNEYLFCVEHNVAGGPGAGTFEKIQQLWTWGEREIAKGDYRTEVQIPEKVGAVYDVANCRPVGVTDNGPGGSRLALSLPRFGGALLAFVSQPIEKIRLAAPQAARVGETVEFKAELLAEASGWFSGWRSGPKLTEVLPVHFELTAPDGSKYFNNRGVATRDGVATFAWKPAINDLKGKWTLIARQLAAGKTSTTAIELQ